MNAKRYYPTIVGGCLAVFAVCAAAQTPATSTAQPPAADAVPAPGATGTSAQQPATTAAPAKAHHAKKRSATHAARASEPRVSSAETQYRMALRQCVEGQAARRDQCLDDAISRYGRS